MVIKVLRTVTVIVFAIIIFATFSSINLRPETGAVGPERFLAFALLETLGGSLYPGCLVRVAVLMVAMVIVLEVLQQIVPTRHGEVSDAVVKALGALVGVGLVVAFKLFITAHHSK